MKWMTWNGTQLVPIGGVPAGPGPDPEDPKVPPPAVISLAATSPSPTQINVSWLAPTDPNADGSIVRYQVDLNGVDYNYNVTSTSLTIGNLDPDTQYTVTVRAMNNYNLLGPDSTVTVWTQVEPPTSTFPAVWDAMIASRDWQTVQDTFAQHTGYQAAGYTYSQLTPGSLTSTHDGQVFEGIRGSNMRVRHNNVTYRGCLVEGGGTYGFDTSPAYGSTYTGTLVEYCTFDGGDPPVDKGAVLIRAAPSAGIAATFRYCRISGWSSGFRGSAGVNVEYCWITRFYGSSVEGAHVSSMVARGENVRFYRNYATEGGSPICSIYFDLQPVHNVTIQENLLTARLSTSGNTPSYLLFGKGGPYEAPATGIVIGANYLGDTVGVDFQYGRMAGMGAVRWNEDGNVRSSQIDFLTGDPI